MYSVISILWEVILALSQGYCLQYFFASFLECRLSKGRRSRLWTAVLYGVSKLGLDMVVPSDYESVRIVLKLTVTLCILVLLALVFFKSAKSITVFLIVAFLAVSEISFFLAYSVMLIGNNLFTIWNLCMEQGYITSIDGFMILIKATAYGLQVLLYVLFAVLLFFSLKRIVKDYKEKDYDIHRRELLFILSPCMVGLLICTLLRMIMITVENKVPKLLYDTYPLLMWIVPAILILSLLSILYGVKLFQDMIYLSREKNSRIILEKQIVGMQEHIQEMEHVYSGIRSMKHDMKNTLAVIMQLAGGNSEEENEELQVYLSELNQTMNRLDYQFKTGNTIVDALLNMKYHEAMRMIPNLQMDVERLLFSDNLQIQSYDIGIILGNALDNAIEACKKLRDKDPDAEAFIRLASFQRGKMLFIEVENSFDGHVIRRRQAEFPVTAKADRELHGIGLANIKEAAKKYHGAVDWSVNCNVFTLSIMMQNERSTNYEY